MPSNLACLLSASWKWMQNDFNYVSSTTRTMRNMNLTDLVFFYLFIFYFLQDLICTRAAVLHMSIINIDLVG